MLGGGQPLYAIAKQLQWSFPETLGEDKLVMMMGALHIEDKMQQMVGKLLQDSGWSNILTQAQILTSGRAQSALDEHHIKRTRYAHQVSLMGLYLLREKAYSNYCSSVQGPPEPLEMWQQRSKTGNPMFMFWSTVMDLELLMRWPSWIFQNYYLCQFQSKSNAKFTLFDVNNRRNGFFL